MRKGLLMVVSGPSGTGKGTVCSELLAQAEDLAYSISATTRQPRAGEVDGKNYYFMDKAEFEQKIDISEQNTYFNQTHILPPLNSSRSGLPNKKARPLDRIGLMFQKRPSENESHKDRSHDSGPDFLQDDSAAEQKLKALAGSALGRYDRVILDHDVVVLI